MGENSYNHQRDRKEQRKRDILKAALEEFSEKGYDKAVLDNVASKAGVAKGTLYLYYKDKQDLFSRTILFVIDNFIDLIKNIRFSNLSPLEKIEKLIKDQAEYFFNNRNLFNLFQMAYQKNLIMSDKALVESLIERKRKIIDMFGEIVEEAKLQGKVKSEIPTEDIITALDGMVFSVVREFRLKEMRMNERQTKRVDKGSLKAKLNSIIKIIFEGIVIK